MEIRGKHFRLRMYPFWLIEFSIKITNNPIKKWAVNLNRHFFQRGNAYVQPAHEEMFNIANHQRNVEQNHDGISSHTCQNDYHPKEHKLQMLRRGGEKDSTVYCWQECKLVQPLWKTIWQFLKKLKIELPNDPAISLLHIDPLLAISTDVENKLMVTRGKKEKG